MRGWLLFLLLGGTSGVLAQDAFRQQFRGNESSFNPAFTGQTGASRITIGLRSQWGSSAGAAPDGFGSRYLMYEEALPCLFFDYGLYVRQDEEGAGGLTTSEFGGRFAVAIPVWQRGRHQTSNLRIGAGLTRGQQRIDFGNLTFLDQFSNATGRLDQNGRPLPTSFRGGVQAESPWYTAVSLGVSLKRGVKEQQGPRSNRPLTYDIGLAVHNWAGILSEDSRQSNSLNGLDARLRERYVASAHANVVVAKRNQRYWSLHPLLIVQHQAGLTYAELGTGISWHRNLEVGVFHHLSQLGREGVDWTSIRTVFGTVLPGGYTRVDLGLSWAVQHGYLKNYVRAPFELTATFSFARSVTCVAIGKSGDFTRARGGGVHCYNFATRGERIYDNVWIQN